MATVRVRWKLKTAEDLGEDSHEWKNVKVTSKGDEIELYDEDQALVASFSKFDTAVFVVD
jgi:hypothetical protein